MEKTQKIGYGKIGIGVTFENRIKIVFQDESEEDVMIDFDLDIEQAQVVLERLTKVIARANEIRQENKFIQ